MLKNRGYDSAGLATMPTEGGQMVSSSSVVIAWLGGWLWMRYFLVVISSHFFFLFLHISNTHKVAWFSSNAILVSFSSEAGGIAKG